MNKGSTPNNKIFLATVHGTQDQMKISATVSLPAVTHFLDHVQQSHCRLVWLVQLV